MTAKNEMPDVIYATKHGQIHGDPQGTYRAYDRQNRTSDVIYIRHDHPALAEVIKSIDYIFAPGEPILTRRGLKMLKNSLAELKKIVESGYDI